MRLCANVPGQYAIQTAHGRLTRINDLIVRGGRLFSSGNSPYDMLTAIPGVSCVKPQRRCIMFPKLTADVSDSSTTSSSLRTCCSRTHAAGPGHRVNWPTPDHFRVGCSGRRTISPTPCNRIRALSRWLSKTSLCLNLSYKTYAAMEPIKVGLLGFGTVGSGTFTVAAPQSGRINARAGRGIEITRIAVRTPSKVARARRA